MAVVAGACPYGREGEGEKYVRIVTMGEPFFPKSRYILLLLLIGGCFFTRIAVPGRGAEGMGK